jgi:hypothetical protein
MIRAKNLIEVVDLLEKVYVTPHREDCTCLPCTILPAIQKDLSKLTTYRIQCNAAMRAQSLGLCKRVIKHAIEDDYDQK